MTSPPDDRIVDRLRDLPDGGAVVFIGMESSDDARAAAERAVGVSRTLAASRSHVLLAGIGGAGVVLDRVRAASGVGLEAVFRGEATLSEIAVRTGHGEPIYLPSGVPEAGRAPNREEAVRRARRLSAVLRKARGTLVLLLDAEVATAAGLAGIDDLVLRGVGPEGAGPEVAPAGRAGAPVAIDAQEEAPRRKRGRWHRHRKRGQTAVARAVAAVTLVAAAVGGWWITIEIFGPEQPTTTELAPRAAGAETTAVGEGGGSGAGTRSGPTGSTRTAKDAKDAAPAAAAAGPTVPLPASRVADRAPALPYSVLIASYSRRGDAASRARRWSADDDILYLVAPTAVQGRVYYRLFAGAEGSRDAATRLMNRLVQRGRKEEASTWDVRPASLAFRLALRATRRGAAARADSLSTRGFPAYVIPAVVADDTVWQVYAGAFESADAGAVLARALAKSGQEAKLVTRRGTRGR